MFAVTVHFEIHTARLEAFLPLMLQNARTSLQDEPGCLHFDTCHTCGTAQVFLYEVYTSRAAFDLHLASNHFKAFDAAVADMIKAKNVQTFEEVLR